MLKIDMAIRQRSDITFEQFWERWHIGHANMARRLADTVGMRRYIQSLSAFPAISDVFARDRGSPGPFSGYAEAWYDSAEAMTAVMNAPASAPAFKEFLEDELNFLDVSKVAFTFTEEYPVITLPRERDVPGTMIKVIYGVRKRADLSRDEFWKRWQGGHAALVRDVAETIGIRKYTQSIGVLAEASAIFAKERGAPPAFDGVSKTWFDNSDKLQAAMKSPQGAAAFKRLLDDERSFLDVAQCVATVAMEYPIIG